MSEVTGFRFNEGDRVIYKLKVPRPGETEFCRFGTVRSRLIEEDFFGDDTPQHIITVEWDDGRTTEIDQELLTAMREEDDHE